MTALQNVFQFDLFFHRRSEQTQRPAEKTKTNISLMINCTAGLKYPTGKEIISHDRCDFHWRCKWLFHIFGGCFKNIFRPQTTWTRRPPRHIPKNQLSLSETRCIIGTQASGVATFLHMESTTDSHCVDISSVGLGYDFMVALQLFHPNVYL